MSLEFKSQVEGVGCYSEVSLPEPVQVGHVSISAFCDAPAQGVEVFNVRGTPARFCLGFGRVPCS